MTEIERIEKIIEDYRRYIDESETNESFAFYSGAIFGLRIGMKLLKEMEERYESETRYWV